MSGNESFDRAERLVCSALREVTAPHFASVQIVPSLDFRRDLGMDSIAMLSLFFILEQRSRLELFSHIQQMAEARLVADIIAIVRRAQGETSHA